MTNKEITKKIEKVISLIKKEYPNIFLSYNYLEDVQAYEIWHNREDLEYNNAQFKKFIGSLLYEYFIKDNIYNIFINYNYLRSLNIEKNLEGVAKIDYNDSRVVLNKANQKLILDNWNSNTDIIYTSDIIETSEKKNFKLVNPQTSFFDIENFAEAA